MSLGLLLLLLAGLGLLGFVAGRQRALAAVRGDARALHSLPGYYGQAVALFS
ncbi:MAG: phosphate transporter permease subunit PstC, partial [Pseudomonadota bacterium]